MTSKAHRSRKVLIFDTYSDEVIIEFTHPTRRTQYFRRNDAASVRRLGNLAWDLVHLDRAVIHPTISRVGWCIREIR